MAASKRLCALALAVLTLAAMVLSSGMARDEGRNFFLPELEELESEEGYERYENDAVKFALDVPEDYELTEPYENVTLVSDGDDFRVSAEYTFTTADQAHFLQCAADFASLIEADRTVLTDWVGSDQLEVLASGWGDVDGTDCYVCAYSMPRNGKDYSGALYIFEGQGDFGCYCLQGLLNEDSDKADLYGWQLEHIVRSFAVTGPYQAEGYTLYEMENEGSPVQFFARDTARVEDYSSSICVYPVDGVYSEANVSIMQTAWDSGDDLETVLDSAGNYYFDYKEDTRYTAQPSHFDLGRYSYDMISLEYYDEGEHYTVSAARFLSGDHYWEVCAEGTDEYADEVAAAFSDTLFSLRLNGDGLTSAAAEAPADTPEPAQTAGGVGGVVALLDMTEAQDNFYNSEYLDPLGYVKDLPGGGRLLVTLYEMVDDSGEFPDYSVYTDAWLIGDGSAVLLGHNELYKEVGGNSGSVSVGEKDGAVYVELEAHLWEGDRFNNYYGYLPVNEQDACFDEGVYMEAHGTVGEEDQGEYVIDGEHWPRPDFDIARSEYVPDGEMPMDIQQGHGNGGVMDFDGLRHWYPD